MFEIPAELLLDGADRRLRRRRARRGDPHVVVARRRAPVFGVVVAEHVEDGRRRTEVRDVLAADPVERLRDVDPAGTDVPGARPGDRVDVSPAVDVEHRQRPEVHVVVGDLLVDRDEVRVERLGAVGSADPLRVAGGPRGVVDRYHLVLVHLRALVGVGVRVVERGVERLPVALDRVRVVREERLRGHLVADRLDVRGVLGVGVDGVDAGVREHVREVVGREPVVQRRVNRADLHRAVGGLQVVVRVRVQHRHPVALLDPARLKRGGEAVGALAELRVRVSRPVDREDRLLVGVVAPRPVQKVRRQQRLVHRLSLSMMCEIVCGRRKGRTVAGAFSRSAAEG